MRSRTTSILILLLALGHQRAAAQSLRSPAVVPAEEAEARNRLRAADALVRPLATTSTRLAFLGCGAAGPLPTLTLLLADAAEQNQWDLARQAYEDLLRDHGDALVPLDDPRKSRDRPTRSVRLAILCRQRLLGLPASVLERHRRPQDAAVEALLREFHLDLNPAPLRRILAEFPAARQEPQARELLGDVAFEQGDFRQAVSWWLSLLDPVEGSHYPGHPRRPVVEARLVLARAFDGDQRRAAEDLAAFRRRHGEAHGELGGCKGNLADTLAELLQSRQRTDAPLRSWTTFGGHPDRNGLKVPCPHTSLWAQGPTWKASLTANPAAGEDKAAVAPGRARVHPVVAEGQVLVPEAHSVRSFDLKTGRLLFRIGDADFGLEPRLRSAQERNGEDWTLTVHDGLAYVRLGMPIFDPTADPKDGISESYLACLDIAPQAPRRLRWKVRAHENQEEPAFFEGAPLVVDRRLFAVLSRVEALRTRNFLVCLDAQDGRRLWKQEMGDAPEFVDETPPRSRHHLLTLAGDALAYCNHAGLVAAFDLVSGKPRWAVRYPSRGFTTDLGLPSPRALAPCLHADGRLYLAPQDADLLLCLEASSGRLVWNRRRLSIVDLVGVAEGRVVFTVPRGIRALDADSGLDDGGWVQPSEGRLPPLGRPLLAGRWVLWPTADPEYPFRGLTIAQGLQERFPSDGKADGEPMFFEPTMLRRLPAGNVVYGEGCLVIAGPKEIAVFVPGALPAREKEPPLRGVFLPNEEERRAGEKAARGDWEAVLKLLELGQFDDPARLAFFLPTGSTLTGEVRGRLRILANGLGKDRPELAALLLRRLLREPVGDAEKSTLRFRLAEAYSRQGCFAAARKHYRFLLAEDPDRRLGELGERSVREEIAARLILPPFPLLEGGEAALPASFPHRTEPDYRLTGWLTLPCAGDALANQVEEACFLRRHRRLARLLPADGTLAWETDLQTEPIWLGRWADFVLVAEKERLLALTWRGGRPVWNFPLPPGPLPREADFRLAGDRVLFLHDRRQVVALDAATGNVAWNFWVPGGRIRPLEEAGRFDGDFFADARQVWLRGIDARFYRLATADGRSLQVPSPTPAWAALPEAPSLTEMLLPERDGRLTLTTPDGTRRWQHRPDFSTSLTGAPPGFHVDGDAVVALVPRNLGPEIVGLDRRTGNVRWQVDPAVLRVGTAPWDSAVHQGRCVVVVGDKAGARSIEDGKLAWSADLPPSRTGWQVRGVPAGFLFTRRDTEPLPRPLPLFFPPPWPPPVFLPRMEASASHCLLLAPEEGMLLWRPELPPGPTPVRVQCFASTWVVAADGAILGFRCPARP